MAKISIIYYNEFKQCKCLFAFAKAKIFFGKFTMSYNLKENVVKRTFAQKNILLKAQMHILMISRTVYERVKKVHRRKLIIEDPQA